MAKPKLFQKLDEFFHKHHETTDYEYNYVYMPPIAMINDTPPGDASLAWLIEAAELQLGITINMLSVVRGEDQADLKEQLDQLRADHDHRDPKRQLPHIAKLFLTLGRHAKDLLGEFFGELEKLLFQLTQPNADVVLILLTIYLGIQDALTKDMFDDELSPDDYDELFVTLAKPEISKTWDQDDVFSDMRVAGPNPLVIQRLLEPLAKFPLSDAQYKAVMGSNDSLDQAIGEGRAYYVDYAALAGLVTGAFMGPQKYIGAPIALFVVPKDGDDKRPRTVGIQCNQTPGEDNPIFSPPGPNASDSDRYAWLMAKTWFQISDGNFHEAIAHLGWTHLLISPFSIATPNRLGKNHPVGKLLHPHFLGTFSINNSAANALIYSEGIIDQIMSGTIDASRATAASGAVARTRTFASAYLPKDLAARGVDDTDAMPYYPYRDCALMIWKCVGDWVEEYLSIVYENEDDPAQDEPLQAWLEELTAHEGGRLGDIGVDGTIPNRTVLKEILQMVIYTASAQHAAVNFPQLPIMSYPPAMPLAAYSPPPSNGTYTKDDLTRLMPRKGQALIQINTGTLLGGLNFTKLGEYDEDYFKDERILKAMYRFRQHLSAAQVEMEKKYPDYPFLRPDQIPQSINI